MKYEDLLEEVGSYGKYQKMLYVLLFVSSIPNGLTMLMAVFLQFTPPHHCNVLPSNLNLTLTDDEMVLLERGMIPEEEGELACCKMYAVNNESLLEIISNIQFNGTVKNMSSVEFTGCVYGHKYIKDYAGMSTVITEFNLVCEKAWIKPVLTSVFMAGMAIGAISGKISDRYGRRLVFLVFTYFAFISWGLAAFAWNIMSYGFFYFLAGLGTMVNFVVSFVIACEVMNVNDRNAMSLGPFLAFAVGYILSPLFGYLFVNWRWLLAANFFMILFYIPLYWLVPESPRWLIMEGRFEDACNVLQKIAKVNGRKVKREMLLEACQTIYSHGNVREGINIAERESRVSNVVLNPILRQRFFVSCFAWFVISLVYYTIGLSSSNFGTDRYFGCLLIAAMEPPSYFSGFLCVKYFGRSPSLVTLMIVSGICCTLAPMLGKFHLLLKTITALIGKFSINAVFFVVYIYFAELMPTLLRNFSVGMGSFFARVSGFIAPYLIFIGNSIHEYIPFIFMGGCAMLCAVLSIIYLPETRGVPMPDTIKDAIENTRYFRLCCPDKKNIKLETKDEEDKLNGV